MKNSILLVLFFITSFTFGQSINDYKAVIIPMKYDFQKSENQYRLQTKSKVNLESAGMKGFYAMESIPAEYNERCNLLTLDVIEEKIFLATKLSLVFKDCSGKIIYQSPPGKSKEKDYEMAYTDAMNNAFQFVNELNYEYNGGSANANSLSTSESSTNVVSTSNTSAVVAATPIATNEVKTIASSNQILYAQATNYGYQLINSEPKVIMKIYKTSNPASFMAKKEEVQGLLISKEGNWFFEYYQNDQLVSEKINVKF